MNEYFCDEPEFVGEIPVRTELEVIPADESNKRIGWVVYETIGFGMVNLHIKRKYLICG